MTRFDYIKSLDAEKAGRYICDKLEDLVWTRKDPVCAVCPWEKECETGKNGIIKWLLEEVEDEE